MSAKARTRRLIVSGIEWVIRLSAAYGVLYLIGLAMHGLMKLCGLD